MVSGCFSGSFRCLAVFSCVILLGLVVFADGSFCEGLSYFFCEFLSARARLSQVLELNGYEATSVTDGRKAVDKVSETPFDVILMDIKMPVMNGVEALHEIKKIRKDAKVIMITTYAHDKLINDAFTEGAYGIMYKPLDLEKLISFIEEVKNRDSKAILLIVDDDPNFAKTL